jgi:tetratricopeptide (TPR) repeat protein
LRAASLFAAAATLVAAAACATPLLTKPEKLGRAPVLPSLQGLVPLKVIPALGDNTGDSGRTALQALSRGRWARACSVSTAVLARKAPDVEALGVFGLCSAVTRDRQAAETALARLRGVENPGYFSLLTQGVLHLQDRAPEKAQAQFRAVLQTHPEDPLALFFDGEAWHARQQTVAAINSFQATLKQWPDYTPALVAASRLMAGAKASSEELSAATSMAERATALEPMNTGYWRLLADLYRRTGQVGRANGIELQYVRASQSLVPEK